MAGVKLELNTTKIVELGQLQCTQEEIAEEMGCSVDTLTRRYAEFLKKGKNLGRIKLRKKQFDLAVAGNVTMLVWLGKQFLGQLEKPDLTRDVSEMTDDELLTKLLESVAVVKDRIKESKNERAH